MNEIVASTPGFPLTNVDVQSLRSPAAILDEAKIAAKALQDVISKKKKPVRFNGEQYLEFEDWQTIGKFYGLVCSTMEPEEVMIDGVVGARARAEVVDVKTGQIIGRASAWCLRDEPNWRSKPLHQLGSMAQTRAGAKALRNILSWVVVLAGYKTTPAEEIVEANDDAIEPNQNRPGSGAPILRPATVAGGVSGSSVDAVHDILDKLVAMHAGDQEKVEEHLKFISKYKNKDGIDKWLTVSDLEGVAKHKPEWIKRIHWKVLDDWAKKG